MTPERKAELQRLCIRGRHDAIDELLAEIERLEAEIMAMRLVRLPEWNRKPGCTCFHEEGDSACNVHGEELPDGSIAVRCQQRGCVAMCDTDILAMSAWTRVDSGWLCAGHVPQ